MSPHQLPHRLQSLLDIIGSTFAALWPRRGTKPEAAPYNGGLMTLEEVATRIGVGVPVIRRAIANGDIPAVRIGRKDMRVERAALERTIAITAAHYGPPS
ncbi:Gene 36 protein (Gp36), putative excisionase (modular protein) [Candidatus Terasakiella magnetica]|nr:Gene 36 protein (Gp36), putative excisionase (modular protein) [Candidatus Terasakiella magnetica]